MAAELASAWPRFATACTADGPALLVVEDLHWAGAELLETLELTVARATGPLLVALEDWPAVGEFLPLARARVGGNALLGPACDRAEGLAHAQTGRPAEAAWALRRALAGFERLSVPFEAARTREHLATLDPPTAARPLLEAGLSTY